MGCEKCKCKECGEVIVGKSNFELIFRQYEHTELKHKEIFENNRLAKETFDKEFKIINDKLIYSEKIIFTPSEWDPEDYAWDTNKDNIIIRYYITIYL